jgi:hypothetical protein
MPLRSSTSSLQSRHAALLFVGTLTGGGEYHRMAVRSIEAVFGPVLRETPPVPWDYSDYYMDEFGPGLQRRFVFFENLIGQEELGEIKLRTISLERELSADGKRRVNIDPGYLTEAKVVLASTKDYSHRVYLGGGVFAEVTLHYRQGGFRPHLFAYPDYHEEENIRLFGEMRGVFRARLGKTSSNA